MLSSNDIRELEDMNPIPSDEGNRTLYLEGAIEEESWYGDEVTPKEFKAELISDYGYITVLINSSGGGMYLGHHKFIIC